MSQPIESPSGSEAKDPSLTPETMFRSMAPSRRGRTSSSLPPAEIAIILKSRLQSLEKVHTFKKGDLVQWKTGLKNRLRPEINQPAIVLEVLSEPIYDLGDDPDTAYFREPLDLALAVLMEDSGFVIYYFDQRRFEPFTGTS